MKLIRGGAMKLIGGGASKVDRTGAIKMKGDLPRTYGDTPEHGTHARCEMIIFVAVIFIA